MAQGNPARNSKSALGMLPWIIWGLAALFYCYEFLLQTATNVIKDDLMRDFMIVGTGFGLLSAAYQVSYALMQIPAGILLDRFGPRLLLTASTLFCAFGVFIFGSTHDLSMAIFGRFLIGLGSAFAVISCFRLAATWFPNKRFALLACLTVTIGMIGAAGGGKPLSALVNAIQWRPTMISFGVVGLVLAILLWIIVRDKPQSDPFNRSLEMYASKSEPLLAGLIHVMKNRQTWICSLYGGLMFAPTITFGGAWSSSFFLDTYHLPMSMASWLMTFVYLGWAVGAPLAGIFSDYIGRRLPLMKGGSFGALVSISMILFVPNLPLFLLFVLMFSFGFFSSGFFTVFALVKESHPTKRAATAMGFMNFFNNLPGILLLILVGKILDFLGTGEMANGVPVFSKLSYTWAMSTLPLSIILAMLLIPFIRETYCKNIADKKNDEKLPDNNELDKNAAYMDSELSPAS